MKKDSAPLPPTPRWETLKADAGFQAWQSSPYLRMMTAALRVAYPMSSAADPHAMIRDAGIISGWLGALGQIDEFCRPDEEEKRETKSTPYQEGGAALD